MKTYDIGEILDGQPFSPFKVLLHMERVHDFLAGRPVAPITVELDLTNKCNHRCSWCVSSRSHTGETLSISRLKKLCLEMQQLGIKSIVIKGGGEPTLHPHFADIVAMLSQAGFTLGLISNGSIHTSEKKDAILENMEWVRISLDACSAAMHGQIHGGTGFSAIIKAISYLVEKNVSTLIGLNFVAEPRNYLEIPDFTAMAKRLGVGYVAIRSVFDPNNRISEDIRRSMLDLGKVAKRMETERFRVFLGDFTERYVNHPDDAPFPYKRCLGPNLVGIVGADGETYACCFLRGDRRFSFGNILKASYPDIWYGPKRQKIMESVYLGECGHICKGGMTTNRYNLYNDIFNYLQLEHKQHTAFI